MKNSISVLLVWFSWIIWWGVNYMYHPLLLNFLSIEDFWIFQGLFAIFNIFSIIIISLSIYLVKEISKNTSLKSINKKQQILKNDLVKLTILLWVIFFISSPFINTYLNINNFYYFLLLSISIIFINLELYIFPFLQWLEKFKEISILRILWSLLRVTFGVWLVIVGFWVYGAIGGFLISQILFIIIWYKYMRKHIPYKQELVSSSETFLFHDLKNLKYFFIASIILTLFQNIDILIVKNIFDGATAGYYAAISVIAKFLVFLWLSIETVYYPQLVKEKTFPKLQILKISAYYILMTLWALGFFWLFWETVLRLFKDGLQDYIWLIYPLLIYCGLLAYLSIIVKTLIAFEKYTINYVLGGLIVLLIISIYSFWVSLLLVTQIFALFSGAGLLLWMSQMWRK